MTEKTENLYLQVDPTTVLVTYICKSCKKEQMCKIDLNSFSRKFKGDIDFKDHMFVVTCSDCKNSNRIKLS
jgi:hypothetical protein